MVDGVRIVAIRALDVASGTAGHQRSFHRVMHTEGVPNRVDAGLVELSLDVLGGNVAVVTGKAVILFGGVVQQALLTTGTVRIVAILTGIRRDGFVRSMWPWIRRETVPRLRGKAVAALAPTG